MRAALALLAVAAATSLVACKDASTPAQQPAAAAQPTAVSIEAITAQAKGFTVGQAMSSRVVYVFFDPQCPHCAALWAAAKPLKSQARFVWIPVGLINDKSSVQGALLLAAKDPEAAMDTHEASLRGGTGGIPVTGAADEAKAAVAGNTKLFNNFGLQGVPAVVARHGKSGELVTREGSMQTEALAAFLGL